jgi:hypothetical protein
MHRPSPLRGHCTHQVLTSETLRPCLSSVVCPQQATPTALAYTYAFMISIYIYRESARSRLFEPNSPKTGFWYTLHMGVCKIPPELAAKYIPPNRLGRGCGPWVQVLGQEPVMEKGAYLKSRGLCMSYARNWAGKVK